MFNTLLESISPTYLQAAFTYEDLKSVIIQSSCQYLIALLKYVPVKVVRKMLMKLTPVFCDSGKRVVSYAISS